MKSTNQSLHIIISPINSVHKYTPPLYFQLHNHTYTLKSLTLLTGNVIDPIDTITQVGQDTLRFTLVTGSTPGQDIPLSAERLETGYDILFFWVARMVM